MSGWLSKARKAMGKFEIGGGVGGAGIHLSNTEDGLSLNGGYNSKDAQWMSFQGKVDDEGVESEFSARDDGETQWLNAAAEYTESKGLHAEGSAWNDGSKSVLGGDLRVNEAGAHGFGSVYADEEAETEFLGIEAGATEHGGGAQFTLAKHEDQRFLQSRLAVEGGGLTTSAKGYQDDQREIFGVEGRGSLGNDFGLHLQTSGVRNHDGTLNIGTANLDVGSWGEEGEERYGFAANGALLEKVVEVADGTSIRGSFGTVNSQANIGQNGFTLGSVGTLTAATAEKQGETAKRGESRLGVGASIGGQVRGHWTDTDKDGKNEWGLGADVGPVTIDHSTEL